MPLLHQATAVGVVGGPTIWRGVGALQWGRIFGTLPSPGAQGRAVAGFAGLPADLGSIRQVPRYETLGFRPSRSTEHRREWRKWRSGKISGEISGLVRRAKLDETPRDWGHPQIPFRFRLLTRIPSKLGKRKGILRMPWTSGLIPDGRLVRVVSVV